MGQASNGKLLLVLIPDGILDMHSQTQKWIDDSFGEDVFEPDRLRDNSVTIISGIFGYPQKFYRIQDEVQASFVALIAKQTNVDETFMTNKHHLVCLTT